MRINEDKFPYIKVLSVCWGSIWLTMSSHHSDGVAIDITSDRNRIDKLWALDLICHAQSPFIYLKKILNESKCTKGSPS